MQFTITFIGKVKRIDVIVQVILEPAFRVGILTIENIDAFDGTSVVDIKCYAPSLDRVMDEIKTPWPKGLDHLPVGGVGI